MKLVIAVVQDQDSGALMDVLMDRGVLGRQSLQLQGGVSQAGQHYLTYRCPGL